MSDRERSRFCVIGGDGAIGSALVSHLRSVRTDVISSTRRVEFDSGRQFHLDLSHSPLPPLPDAAVFILAASTTRLADCRSDPTATQRVNVDAQIRIAESILAKQASVIFLSTAMVFDGAQALPAPNDPPSPASVYGRQKAEAESALLRLGSAVAIVRLGKVIGRHLPLFENWRRDLLTGASIVAFDDLVMAPIAIAKVVAGIEILGRKRASGIHHLCGREDISYLEAAEHLARRLGAPLSLVRTASAADAGIPIEERPRRIALSPGAIEEEVGLRIGDARAELDLGLELIP